MFLNVNQLDCVVKPNQCDIIKLIYCVQSLVTYHTNRGGKSEKALMFVLQGIEKQHIHSFGGLKLLPLDAKNNQRFAGSSKVLKESQT